MINKNNNPKGNLIRGAIWTVCTRLSIKGIGFINTVIMARLLAPEDYGVVAMGMLVVGLIQTFLDFSATLALLRKDEITRAEIDSTWTLRLIQGTSTGIILVLVAPFAVQYFQEPTLQYVIWTFAVCVFLGSASNIGQTLALKKYDYTLDFKIQTTGKLVSVLTTICFGLLLHDYRALVLGIVAGYLTPLVLSYTLHPYRPRWDTSKIGEIWVITKWLLLSNIGTFILRKGDEFIAGRIGTTHEFGLYNVGSDLGQLPVAEVGPAMYRALLPVLSSIQADAERTKKAVLKTMSAINTVIWPVGLGFAAISAEATELLLGNRWLDTTKFVSVFAVTAVLQTTVGSLRTFLILKGATKTQNQAVWIEFVTFSVCAAIFVPTHHLLGLAYARLLSSLMSSMSITIATKHFCDLDIILTLRTLARPIAGSIIMYLIVSAVMGTTSNLYYRLGSGILIGGFFYTSFIFVSWYFFGCPEGLESTLYDKLKKLS